MCGIAGILHKRRPVEIDKIRSMLNSFPTRGPDGEGLWLNNRVGLAHKRLSIFDLKQRGNQPMISSNGRYIISYNGEIYNWPEIRKTLKFNKWKTKTDTEVVLQAFVENGADCLEKFNGMFAISIWDNKKKELFIARDRVGIKPLFYFYNNETFYFASEIKAIIAAGYKKSINYDSIYNFLKLGLIDHSEQTFFKNVKSLLPGHYMIIKNDLSIQMKCYWNLREISNKKIELSENEIKEKYNQLLSNSIKIQMRADVDIGVSLSGGVDSEVLIALASKEKKIQSFTFDFKKNLNKISEYKDAKKTSDKYKIKNNLSLLSPEETPALIDEVIKNSEAPVTSIIIAATYKMYKDIKKNKCKVILDGSGGDECGAAYEAYYAPHIVDNLSPFNNLNVNDEFQSFMKKYKIPENKQLEHFLNSLRRVYYPGVATHDGVNFVKDYCFNNKFMKNKKNFNIEIKNKSLLKSAQLNDFMHVLLPRRLRYLDRASMNSSIEARVPYLDHRIVELSFQVPTRMNLSNGNSRLLQKNFFYNSIRLQQKSKKSIQDPQRQWLKTQLNDWVFDNLNSRMARNCGIFNQKQLLNEFDKFRKGIVKDTSFHIFQYVNIILWMKNFF